MDMKQMLEDDLKEDQAARSRREAQRLEMRYGFLAGDVVRLRSGGPRMTVVASPTWSEPDRLIGVIYFNKVTDLQVRGLFPGDCLVRAG